MYARIDEIGGPLSHNNYPWGWTMAGNTPFKRWKREVHEGGVADPCIVRWPAGCSVAPGVSADQFAHAIDVLPTVLELAGVERARRPSTAIDQSHLDGIELRLPARTPTGTRQPGRTRTQYFEMFGSRAIYHDGWKAVTYHPVGPLYDDGLSPNAPFDEDVWELYHVAEDLSESSDLAAAAPREAGRAGRAVVGRGAPQRRAAPRQPGPVESSPIPSPTGAGPTQTYRYFQDGAQVPEAVAVSVRNRSHAIAVDVEVAERRRADGVLLALGSALGGWSLHVLDGRLRYVHNLYGKQPLTSLESDRHLGAGSPPRRASPSRRTSGLGGPATADRRRGGGRRASSTASPRPPSTGSGSASPVATSGDRRSATATRPRSPSTGPSSGPRST